MAHAKHHDMDMRIDKAGNHASSLQINKSVAISRDLPALLQ